MPFDPLSDDDLARALTSDAPETRDWAWTHLLHRARPIPANVLLSAFSAAPSTFAWSAVSRCFEAAPDADAVDRFLARWTPELPWEAHSLVCRLVELAPTPAGLAWLRARSREDGPIDRRRAVLALTKVGTDEDRASWWAQAPDDERVDVAVQSAHPQLLPLAGDLLLTPAAVPHLLAHLDDTDDEAPARDPREVLLELDEAQATVPLAGGPRAWSAGPAALDAWLGALREALPVDGDDLTADLWGLYGPGGYLARLDAVLAACLARGAWPVDADVRWAIAELVAFEARRRKWGLDLRLRVELVRERTGADAQAVVDVSVRFAVHVVEVLGRHQAARRPSGSTWGLAVASWLAVLGMARVKPRYLARHADELARAFAGHELQIGDEAGRVLRAIGPAGLRALASPDVPLRAVVRAAQLAKAGTAEAFDALGPDGAFVPRDDAEADAVALLARPARFADHVRAWRSSPTPARRRVLERIDAVHGTALVAEATALGALPPGGRRAR